MKKHRPKLTQKRLRDVLEYNPQTGIFVWKKNISNIKAGTQAGTKRKDGYVTIKVDGRFYYAHRLSILWVDGYLPENQIDHIDRNPSNNKRSNLREVSHTCNMRNHKLSKANKSGITGITWEKRAGGAWVSYICIASKKKYLGTFRSITDAAEARWLAEKRFGFPGCCSNSLAYQHLVKEGRV